MKIELSKSKSPRIRPRLCFDLGQRVTEVGAALAYVDYFARRADATPQQIVRDVSAGIHTAARKAGELTKDLHGKTRSQANRFMMELWGFNNKLREKFVITPVAPLTPRDLVEIQQKTSRFRRRVTEIWDSVRQECGDGAKKAKKAKKGKKK